MAYSEVIKSFNKVRDYMREFYVYGFKSREEYTRKSSRSYDDERRRVESWLGDYMQFRQTPEGKNVFLSIDSRLTRHNPLYKAWKAKSFTDGEITLHFILMDLLAEEEQGLTLKEIMERLDGYLEGFEEPRTFDESTVRKKLKNYEQEGILTAEKQGRTLCYKRSEEPPVPDGALLDFFSEAAPCGVIGSFLMDKKENEEDLFAFKHHYITGALDSEVLCQIFAAMQEKRNVTLEVFLRRTEAHRETEVVPLKVMFSAQSGRQYLLGYMPGIRRIRPFRLDNIVSVKAGDVNPHFDELRERLKKIEPHLWGISTQSPLGQRLEKVEFTVRYGEDEPYIHQRLEREKRCGTVEKIDANTSRFTAEVYDAGELMPWIRTFLCRITEIRFSNPELEERFRSDLAELYEMYGLEGGGEE